MSVAGLKLESLIVDVCARRAATTEPHFFEGSGKPGVLAAIEEKSGEKLDDGDLAAKVLLFYPENGIVGFDLPNPKNGRALYTQSATLPKGNRGKQGLLRQRGLIRVDHADHPVFADFLVPREEAEIIARDMYVGQLQSLRPVHIFEYAEILQKYKDDRTLGQAVEQKRSAYVKALAQGSVFAVLEKLWVGTGTGR